MGGPDNSENRQPRRHTKAEIVAQREQVRMRYRLYLFFLSGFTSGAVWKPFQIPSCESGP
jgi:hypothetical protein